MHHYEWKYIKIDTVFGANPQYCLFMSLLADSPDPFHLLGREPTNYNFLDVVLVLTSVKKNSQILFQWV